jgi:hypothetical protein
MRIPFFAIAALSCIGIACGGVTDVDDLFTPTPTGGASGKGAGGGPTGGSGGGTGGSGGGTGGSATGGTGGTGGSVTGGTGGMGGGAATGGTGGIGGAGTGGTGGTGGTTVDSGAPDARRDAAADTRDAGKGGIRCGATTCDPASQFCCLSSSNTRCLAASSTSCSSSTDRLHCDDTADCPVGQVCCASEGSSSNGAAAVCILTTLGCGSPKQMLCDPAVVAPCLGITNLVCSPNGSGIFQEYAYCHTP